MRSSVLLIVPLLLVMLCEGEEEVEYPPFDGWFNNLAYPDWGGAETQLFRRVPPAYSDGVYEPAGKDRPNPIEISNAVFKGSTGQSSVKNRTAFLVFFGQQVVEEVLDAQRPGCPPEYFNIKVPEGHDEYDKDRAGDIELPLLRSRYDMNTGYSPNVPRQQLNEISAWIDGTLMYGANKAWTDSIRAFEGGRLKGLRDDDKDAMDFPAYNDIRLPMANPPPPRNHPELKRISRFYMLGNPRGNENPFLLTFGILWFRYHNYWARRLEEDHPNWSDEKLFNEARKMVIGVHQNIVVYDWLPAWLGEGLEPYNKSYDPTVNPGIAAAFQTSAMRFGHTLVPPGVFRRSKVRGDNTCEFYDTSGATGKEDAKGFSALRTCQTYWNPQEGVNEYDIDALLMGMASQRTEREDMTITPDLRGSVFGPLEFNRRDLMAVNIQRGRDHGVPDYNTVRKYYGLEPRTDFNEINTHANRPDDTDDRIAALKRVYKDDINNLDLWPAGMLETTYDGPGETFRAIIKDQFLRIRNGDRFWFENYELNGLWTEEEVQMIKSITIKDVVMNVTDIKEGDMQSDPFIYDINQAPLDEISCRQPHQLDGDNRTHLAECTKMQTFDYFTGSEVSYALCFTALFATFFIFLGCLFCAAKYHRIRVNRQRNKGKEEAQRHSRAGFVIAEEWVNRKEGCREVHIRLDDDKKQIMVKNHRDRLLRTIDLKLLKGEDSNSMEVIMSADYDMRMMVIRVPREYDLVLKFDTKKKASEFQEILDNWCGNGGLGYKSRLMPRKEILTTVTTASDRQDAINNFLIYAMKRVLVFDSPLAKDNFYKQLRDFVTSHGLGVDAPKSVSVKQLKSQARTKLSRQHLLDKFFRAVFTHAFKYGSEEDEEDFDKTAAKEVLTCELTKYEFADTLQLKPNSLFVSQMFEVVDKDKNGYISFREFLDMIVVFFNGSAEEKTRLMFDMYDVDRSGRLTVQELKTMLKSMMELANDTIDEAKMEELINKMFTKSGTGKSDGITFEQFQAILADYQHELAEAKLDLNIDGDFRPDFIKGAKSAPLPEQAHKGQISRAGKSRATLMAAYKSKRDDESAQREKRRFSVAPHRMGSSTEEEDVGIKTEERVQPKGAFQQYCASVKSYFETYKRHIFWVTLYTWVTLGIFAERAYYYSIEREHAGLRRIAGYGVSVTRGAASGMMFTYSCLLVTMCRNLITHLRETFLHRFVPFDAAIAFHKYIAWWALIFTVMHCIGHSINFYHISTQTADDLTCLFRNFFHATDELPKFTYWLFQTITGFTGVLATLVVFVMYIFAQQYARRATFRGFWLTHHLYIALYILMILHGAGRLVQPPFFHYFFLGPVILFVLDKLVSISRRKVEIQVVKAELLPSEVTHLKFQRPEGFDYKSGQWVRIASIVQSENEYHPFTLTSSPHEEYLSLHIRAVGPWTMNLRQIYDPNRVKEHAWPKIFLDGPYGEGHQDWYKYDVAVLVGGGIGVTPFASILKDIAQRSKNKEKIQCKKVYFIWVTRTQKQFEWMTDIIREVEEKDINDIVSVHIFITQYKEKFDVRTTMLYICERYFQKISSRSLFTGLRSITHFGRPNFNDFFKQLQLEHNDTEVFGVFSCGPPPMTGSVEKACSSANKQLAGDALFVHHYENF